MNTWLGSYVMLVRAFAGLEAIQRRLKQTTNREVDFGFTCPGPSLAYSLRGLQALPEVFLTALCCGFQPNKSQSMEIRGWGRGFPNQDLPL